MARRKAATTHWVWADYGRRRGFAFADEVFGLSENVELELLRGERLARVPRNAAIGEIRVAPRDIVGLMLGGFCVSPRLREVLADVAGIQWIPMDVDGQDYAIPHVTTVVPAIDLKKSKYRTFLGGKGIAKIERLVPRRIPAEIEIFKPAESRTLIVIADGLKQRLSAASKWAGQFTALEDYRNES